MKPDIVVQLLALERQGEDYIWRPAVAAREEITRLRANRDSLTARVAELERENEKLARANEHLRWATRKVSE